jgi:rfaE bifunctional protein kinase chain/domain
VLGDLMVDRFIYGDARRLSPEAPVPVVEIRRRTTQPGGAANVGNNVLSLGGRLHLFGLLGDDDAGCDAERLLAAAGANLDGVWFDKERPSTVKTRIVAQSQQLVRFDEEETAPAGADLLAWLLERIDAALPALQVFVISDYAKGLLSAGLVSGAIERCRARGIPVVADPKPVNVKLFMGVDVIKPNLGEALRLAGIERELSEAEMPWLCCEVRERCAARSVIVTAGARGMYILDGEEFTHLPALAREVYDVAGAGDSTLAAIALALGCQAPLAEAARLGNLAGAIAVGKLGVAAVQAAELRAAVEALHGMP